METYRTTRRTMRLVLLLCQLGLILKTKANTPDACIISPTNRAPNPQDISVTCGTEYIDLSIFLCPVYHSGYNESLLLVNRAVNQPECHGVADLNNDPPVIRFRFHINENSSSCDNNVKIIDKVGSGHFSDFSNVQYMYVSGLITSVDPPKGTITYNAQVQYQFSCLYPMQYYMNNTEVGVSGVNLAMKDSNGTFMSTLSMRLFQDENYQDTLNMPQTGLNLKTKIYVAVMAQNLTDRFNVLLDRCYATTSPYPIFQTFYDLFVGCTRDDQTKVELNGVSQMAHFSFEAFRFVEHKNQPISTFYLHCITRLCEVSSCSSLLPDCENGQNRRKREVTGETATVTSAAILVQKQMSEEAQMSSLSHGTSSESNYSSPVVGLIVCIVILAVLLIAMAAYFAVYIRRKKIIVQ